MHEIADFLRGFPPFDAADDEALAAVVAATEIEFFPDGAFLLRAGGDTERHVHVVRAGHVELIDAGRVLDVAGPGDMVGLPSLVSDLPPGLDVRAADDVLTYRVPAEVLLPLLSGRSGLRFVARTVRSRTVAPASEPLRDTADASLGDLARPAVVVPPGSTLRDLVAAMHADDVSCALVRTTDGELGIVTDKDLRNRVLAVGVDLDAPAETVATSPVRAAAPASSADDAVLTMLAHGIRHLPVVERDGTVVGVVEDVDLLAAQSRTPVRLRRALGRATTPEELADVAAGILPSVLAAVRAGQPAPVVTAGLATLQEAVVAKAVELHVRRRGTPPAPFCWLTTGSVARGEAVPSSDVDSLLAWDGGDDDAEVRSWMRSLAAEVLGTVAACGLTVDEHGVRADDARFSRSVDAWCAALDTWAEDPTAAQADIYLAAVLDARPTWGHATWTPVQERLRAVLARPLVRHTLHRVATAHHTPTGFARDLVIEGSGEHAGTLDLKRGGLVPIASVGRYVSVLLPGRRVGTADRVATAGALGLLGADDARDLVDALAVVQEVRLQHQVAQVDRDGAPDDHVRPDELTTLQRRHLRDAFRVVRRVQQRLPSPVARP